MILIVRGILRLPNSSLNSSGPQLWNRLFFVFRINLLFIPRFIILCDVTAAGKVLTRDTEPLYIFLHLLSLGIYIYILSMRIKKMHKQKEQQMNADQTV